MEKIQIFQITILCFNTSDKKEVVNDMDLGYLTTCISAQYKLDELDIMCMRPTKTSVRHQTWWIKNSTRKIYPSTPMEI